MTKTTIILGINTKRELDLFKEYKNETYDEVINKLVYIAKNVKEQPELSQETILAIENARNRIKEGRFITEKEALRRLGM
ncbi:MAG: hypothetical protein ACMXYB_04270 [Candidatus Woesearchaeota archaeon]